MIQHLILSAGKYWKHACIVHNLTVQVNHGGKYLKAIYCSNLNRKVTVTQPVYRRNT